MKKKLLLIGGGGHCHSVLDSVLSMESYDEIGIIDNNEMCYNGIRVIGTDKDIPELIRNGWTDAFVSVGSIGNTIIRRKLFEMIKKNGLQIPIIIDPTAVISVDAEIQEGAFVGKKAIINAGSSIGACSIVNTGSIIEHDCTIGAFSHISSGAVLCGQVIIGHDTHVGAASVIKQSIVIGNDSLVGIGSVVVNNLPDGVLAYGNPCKVVRT